MQEKNRNDQNSTDSTQETFQKDKEISEKVYATTKEATGDVLLAIKMLFIDPIGGQSKALNELGKAKALLTGIVFIAIFVFVSILLLHSVISPLSELSRVFGGQGLGVSIYFKLIIISIIAIAAIFSCFFLISEFISREYASCGIDVNRSVCIFTTGISVIPIIISGLLLWIFGINNFKLVFIIVSFCASWSMLLVNGSLLDIYKISTQKSFWLTPTIFLASVYITKIFYSAIM